MWLIKYEKIENKTKIKNWKILLHNFPSCKKAIKGSNEYTKENLIVGKSEEGGEIKCIYAIKLGWKKHSF